MRSFIYHYCMRNIIREIWQKASYNTYTTAGCYRGHSKLNTKPWFSFFLRKIDWTNVYIYSLYL